MSTITTGASTITPTLITTYEAGRAAQNIVHPILGSATPDVTLRPALARSGRMVLGFAGASCESDSAGAVTALASGAVLTLTDTDRPTHSMTFIVTGSIARDLDDDTRNAYTVTFDWQEVA